MGSIAESGHNDDSPSPGYCKHSLHWTPAELLSRQLGTKQLGVTWEASLESQWSGMLFLAAGMYTVASWQALQRLTGKPCRFTVSCSFSCLETIRLDNVSVLFQLKLFFFWADWQVILDIIDQLRAGGKDSPTHRCGRWTDNMFVSHMNRHISYRLFPSRLFLHLDVARMWLNSVISKLHAVNHQTLLK